MGKIRVMLVDDHTIVRDGLKMLLELDDSFTVCAEAGSLKEALARLPEAEPQVVLLDFRLPDGDGVNGCQAIKRFDPGIKVIILTAYSEDHLVRETVRAGAEGYLLKNIAFDNLTSTIKLVNQGALILDPAVSEAVLTEARSRRQATGNLSLRETEILRMISTGRTNKEIAGALNISDKTVRNYISSLFRKINVTNRTEAAAFWMRNQY